MKKNIFDYIEQIENRMTMYIPPDDDVLDTMALFIAGYEAAIYLHEIDEPGKDFSRNFSDHLRAKHNWDLSYGWHEAFRRAYKKDEVVKKLFEGFRDYKVSLDK